MRPETERQTLSEILAQSQPEEEGDIEIIEERENEVTSLALEEMVNWIGQRRYDLPLLEQFLMTRQVNYEETKNRRFRMMVYRWYVFITFIFFLLPLVNAGAERIPQSMIDKSQEALPLIFGITVFWALLEGLFNFRYSDFPLTAIIPDFGSETRESKKWFLEILHSTQIDSAVDYSFDRANQHIRNQVRQVYKTEFGMYRNPLKKTKKDETLEE